MKFNNLIKKYLNIFNLLLTIFGIFMVFWIIWVRFIREKLPKDIPFELSEIKFYFLSYACIIYLIIIFSLLFPREPNKIIKKLIEKIFLPLITLDKFIKNNRYVTAKYIKFLEKYIEPKIYTKAWFYPLNIEIRYTLINIVPRCILISILLVEVFYHKRIELFYTFILLGILPLLHRYLKYSYKNMKEQYIYYYEQQFENIYILIEDNEKQDNYEENPEKYPEVEYHEQDVTVRQYFENVLPDERIKYFASPSFKENFLNKYKFDENNCTNKYILENKILDKNQLIEKLESNFRSRINIYNVMKSYYPLYSKVTNNSYITWLKTRIYSLYFICWFYILCLSFHTLNDMPTTLRILNIIIEYLKNEPFSQINLEMTNKELWKS